MSLLKNLKNFLNFLPEGALEKPAVDLKKEELSESERKEIIKFTKAAYPYVYAYRRVFDECCRVKEELGVHNFLKSETRKKFDKFIREGGDVEHIRQGKVDEQYLTAAEMEEFRQAEEKAHEQTHCEVRKRIKEQDEEKFKQYINEGKGKVAEIDKKIVFLREFAGKSPEMSGEIFGKIDELEERWANYGNEPKVEDLNELLEYYDTVAVSE